MVLSFWGPSGWPRCQRADKSRCLWHLHILNLDVFRGSHVQNNSTFITLSPQRVALMYPSPTLRQSGVCLTYGDTPTWLGPVPQTLKRSLFFFSLWFLSVLDKQKESLLCPTVRKNFYINQVPSPLINVGVVLPEYFIFGEKDKYIFYTHKFSIYKRKFL